jgi:carboxyl-terminal processing protease
MPRKNLIIFLALLFVTALGISRAFSEDKYLKQMQTFALIIHHVREHYVREVEPQELFEGAYAGVCEVLDPYSQYFPPKQNKTFTQDTDGKFGGLGIEISIRQGILTVISPIRGTPAYDAGIQAGDQVLKIAGKSTERITMQEAVDRLRGKPGTSVVLTVRHVGSRLHKDITIERAIIKPISLEWAIIDKENGIGFLRMASFNAQITTDLPRAVAELKAKGMKGLIIDLRQNPGGLLGEAVKFCDEFIAKGKIVSVKGRVKSLGRAYSAKPGGTLEDIPLVVLIDGGSASASEIFAGCIRDHKRGMLIGSRTYGKGSVQNVIDIGGGQALKLTTAKYYTPNDKPIEDREGIVPDMLITMPIEHLVALRDQEREDKLRGHYDLGANLIEEIDLPEDAADKKDDAPKDGKDKDGKMKRRSRVIDFQLKAAVNALKFKLGNVGK